MLRTRLRHVLKIEINLRTLARFRSVLVGSNTTAESSSNQQHDRYKLQFNDARLATETKSFSDILRALVILKLCTIETLVDNSEKVLFNVLFCCVIFIQMAETLQSEVRRFS